MLAGVMLLWGILTVLSVVYVAVDVRNTPENSVMKLGFVIITVFIGPLGAFLYVLGCREPLPGTHEAYVSAEWRQVLGSTMHCVAGDGIGIVAAATITAQWHWPLSVDLAVEYAAGFLFGWTIFQSLFMKDMMGGSYLQALRRTFLPEWFSMNGVMAGMMVVMTITMSRVLGAHSPASPSFWFIMSMSLLAGLIVAYPINWWLVSLGLKHGMTTVRPEGYQSPRMAELSMAERAQSAPAHRHADKTPAADAQSLLAAPGVAEHRAGHPMPARAAASSHHHGALVESRVSRRTLWALGAGSLVVLAVGVVAAAIFGNVGLS